MKDLLHCDDFKTAKLSLGFPGGSDNKESTCLVKTWIQCLGWEDPLEEDMGIRILAWRIPWTEEPGGLYSMGHTESGTA